jgi:purine-binding chemotaxis protein CheW
MRNNETNHAVMEALAFTPGKEEYGVNILKMQKIGGYHTVTRIANARDFIKGSPTCAASLC